MGLDTYKKQICPVHGILQSDLFLCERNGDKIALIKSAERSQVIIHPNTKVTIQCHLDQRTPYFSTCALLQATKGSAIPEDLDITPSLVNYDCNSTDTVPVEISNITTRTVAVNPRSLVCEVQPVRIEGMSNASIKTQDEPFSESLNIDREALRSDELRRGIELIDSYADVFAKSDIELEYTGSVKHRILLNDDILFKQRHRRIPPAIYEEVKAHIKELLSANIIRPSHSPFPSNIVLVRKKDGKLQTCVEFRQLNKRTIKDSYALPRIEELLDSRSGAKFFSVLDMKSGYYQVEIEESHKERTAFTVGPLGFNYQSRTHTSLQFIADDIYA